MNGSILTYFTLYIPVFVCFFTVGHSLLWLSTRRFAGFCFWDCPGPVDSRYRLGIDRGIDKGIDKGVGADDGRDALSFPYGGGQVVAVAATAVAGGAAAG